MKRKRAIKIISRYCFLFYVFSSPILSQEKPQFQIADSLKKYSYEDLYSKFSKNINDLELIKLYSNTYLNKAKNEKDTLRIANGFSQFAFYGETQIALKYYDSIIQITKNNNYNNYPGYGYLWKGYTLFNTGKYDDALKNLLIAQKYAEKENNIQQLLTLKKEIGSIKLLWGNKDEAIECFKYVLKKIDHPDIPKEYSIVKNDTYRYLSYSFMYNKKFDSAYYYAKKHLNTSNKYNNELLAQISNDELIAEIEFHKGDYSKAIEFLENIRKKDSLALTVNDFNFNYLYGVTLNSLDKKDEAFYYLSKADSIYIATNDLMPETRKVKEFFINYYKKENNIQKQLLYIDQLLVVDSLIAVNTKTLNRIIQKEYDEPLLLAEKEKIIKNLSEKSTKNNSIILFLSSGVILAGIAFLGYYKKQKNKFNKLTIVNKQNNKKEISTVENIPTEVIEQIRLKLIEFEKNNSFLDNKLTLTNLAKQLETNSNYLSKTINHFKQKNYSTYISDLRIEYCIQKLKTDSTFRKFSVKAIAFEVGFNNTESFSKSFYTKTEIYPSNFIKKLNKK